ncbi:MAG: TIGR02450 family Trp-rich protein [Gammaproteobacteria bacterium HGW-Gammaproteobacteria-11]|nr:MAG: TIGR02450 family Trp-rich protein [Gammaproteobacteria bacterium HGW-Gammaproteobacteria-11]
MNRFNPRKLLHSKWTAVQPRNREKHFMVIACIEDEQATITGVELEAVHSRRSEILDWRRLQDSELWRQGWH